MLGTMEVVPVSLGEAASQQDSVLRHWDSDSMCIGQGPKRMFRNLTLDFGLNL